MRLFVLSLVFLGFFAAPVAANPLPADSAFQLAVSRSDDGGVRFDWTIAEGYYLYRAHISARGPDGAEINIETSPGTAKDDPIFGITEIYYRQATATISNVPRGLIELTYQASAMCLRRGSSMQRHWRFRAPLIRCQRLTPMPLQSMRVPHLRRLLRPASISRPMRV